MTTLPHRPQLSHVVFDFDGTLSWLRHGWPGIMLGVFRRHLPRMEGESPEARDALLRNITLGMNGQPTILQMVRFAEVARARGGSPPEPEALRQEYQGVLDEEIAARSRLVRSGEAGNDAFVVHGARKVIEKLQGEGLTLIVLSGTIEHRVKEEAELLGLTRYFGRHIYGSTPDAMTFSKMQVFERLLREEGITGEHLLSFGDGPVEIRNTKELGGVAIAVCSDEDRNGSGDMDPYKQSQLLAAGADAAIPDYRDACALMDYLRRR